MKTMKIAVAAMILGLAGCADTPQQTNYSSLQGETKAQVSAQYGQPLTTVQMSTGGETWSYVMGMGKKFIPFYGAFSDTSTLIVHFDASGRVTSWEAGKVTI